jgi:uncharacterized RDD family membrane protein YckC
MTKYRIRAIAVAGLLFLTPFAAGAYAQRQTPKPAPTPPPIEQRFEKRATTQTTQTTTPDEVQRRYEDAFYRRPTLRLFQNYTLPQGDVTREVVSVLADAEIDGTVRGDVAVIMGNAKIGPTAVIEGSLMVIGGSGQIAAGAKVGRDVVVIGGTLESPVDFVAGGEHVIIGTPIIGEYLHALRPWLTRGLLLGRLIVPDIWWVWAVVGVLFFFGMLFNHIFARQVGACADTLARRPVGSFFVGLLAMILAGPAMMIVAVTVIGLPFAIAAMIAASIIGKLGVTRAIGRSVVGETEPGSRGQAFRSYLIGSAILIVALMVPVIGLLTWAMISVFGFGTATMTFISSLRKERPAPPAPVTPPIVTPPPPVTPPFVSPAPSSPSGYSAASSVEDVPPPYAALSTPAPAVADAAGDVFREEPPPIASPPLAAPPPTPSSAPRSSSAGPATPGDLLSYPRASFLDRMVAFALDALLVAIASNLLDIGLFRHNHDNNFLVLLFIYHVGFWAWKGTTLGGIICNLRMVRTTGETPRFIDALVRGLSAIFSVAALGIGCFWMLNDPERQMWHDKFAGTVVVKLPRELVLA